MYKLFAAIDLLPVNCGHVSANQSAWCAAKFVNIGRYVVVASKSGPVETGPTILVATALFCMLIVGSTCNYAFFKTDVCDTGGEERTTTLTATPTVIPTGVTTMTSETSG